MKKVISISKGSVKLALYTTVCNDDSDAPGYAYLEISTEKAKAILTLIELTNVFREQAGQARLISPFFPVSFGSGEKLPTFRLIQIPFKDDQAPTYQREIVRLPANFDATGTEREPEYRVECHRIEIGEEQVWFTALLRHGSDEFTTVDLSIELLRAIAEGRDCGLPLAKLEQTPFSSTNRN